VNDGRVTLYPGGYDDYESARLERAAEEDESRQPAARAPASEPPAGPRAGSRKPNAAGAAAGRDGDRDATRRQRAERQKREREQARIEKDIESREARVRTLEAQLADPEVYHDGARAKELVGEYERLRAELESLWQRIGDL
jgi:ATP-binding cassette subfamily F protein 3